jgi:hypothetical protein
MDTAAAAALGAEPANALSLPTWAIHVSSVTEWWLAMTLVWKYADAAELPRWKNLTWAMVCRLSLSCHLVQEGLLLSVCVSPLAPSPRLHPRFEDGLGACAGAFVRQCIHCLHVPPLLQPFGNEPVGHHASRLDAGGQLLPPGCRRAHLRRRAHYANTTGCGDS